MALEFLNKLKDKLLGGKPAEQAKSAADKKNPRGKRPQGQHVERPRKSSKPKDDDSVRRSSRGPDDENVSGRRPRRDGEGNRRGNRSNRPSRDGFSRRRERDEQDRAHLLEHEASAVEAPVAEVVPEVSSEPWDPSVYQVEPAEGKKRFHDFDLPEEIMHAIYDLGFQYCTPIQAGSLDNALKGQNVAGRAQTGTGKTAAYLVAILTRYLRSPDKRNNTPAMPRALVIAPTRELCVQICRDAQALGKYTGLRSLAVFGGMDYAKQQRQLNEGLVDLVAATPGRLLDFQRSHVIDLSHVDTLVIDEADRMLDMGFIPDVTRIIRHLPVEGRQTLLYSATLNEEVMRLASRWMPDPVKVEIEPEHTTAETIEQRVYIVTHDQKFTILCHLLEKKRGQRVLVFANRRSSTERLAERLRRYGYDCELLSGDVNQNHRMRVLDDFRAGRTTLVVATDVAGRGLDIADLDLVVNFELPYEAEDYVHRIGRTGRAGHIGVAVSFADDDESFVIPEIEEYMGEPMKCTQPEDELLEPLPRPPRREHEDRRGGRQGRGERRPRREERFQKEDEARETSTPADGAADASESPAAGQPVADAVPEAPVVEPAPVEDAVPEAPVVEEKASETPVASAEPEPAPVADVVAEAPVVEEKDAEAVPAAESAPEAAEAASEAEPAPAADEPSAEETEKRPRHRGHRSRGRRDGASREGQPEGEKKPRAPRGERGPRQPRGERRPRGEKRTGDKPAQPARPEAPSRAFRPVVVPPGTHAQVWTPGE